MQCRGRSKQPDKLPDLEDVSARCRDGPLWDYQEKTLNVSQAHLAQVTLVTSFGDLAPTSGGCLGASCKAVTGAKQVGSRECLEQ